jgi:small subunit ribosomal protein S17
MSERGRPKTRVGTVVSNKMNKTVVVEVERRVKHPKYGKYVTRSVSYKVHVPDHRPPEDPKKITVNEGDTVRISETSPLSKDKRWRLVETIIKAVSA